MKDEEEILIHPSSFILIMQPGMQERQSPADIGGPEAGRVERVIHYRTFRNADPPGLVEVWNAAFTGRGAVRLQGPTWMEYFLFAKPYFDPHSLIIACADSQIVGFAWAGFGADDSESTLFPRSGVLCLLG